jgi:hypothetical protein
MPRALWLVLAAGVAVWAAAFLQVEERAIPAAAAPEPEAATSAPASRPVAVAVAREASPAPGEDAPAAAAAPTRAPNVLQPSGPRGLLGTASATIRAARDAFVPGPRPVPPPEPVSPDQVATGELGEGVFSPEYHALERAYTHEPRDGAWAANEERLIRFSLRATPLNQQLSLVNCQQTICRMVFERAQPDAFKQLAQNPELAKITGISSASPYSYRSGQLSVYFARRSAIIEGTAQPTQSP